MIDITGIDLKGFAKDVYDLSVPQGLGFIHAQEGGLSDEDAERYIRPEDQRIALDMDYVHGRPCKMAVLRKDNRLTIGTSWYGHTDEQLEELLSRHKIDYLKGGKHPPACNCVDCRNGG